MVNTESKKIITVAICTYNRYDFLPKTIESIRQQSYPQENYDLLIVDNGTDDLGRQEFEDTISYPRNAKTIYSTPPGLTIARNRAIEECKTPYIVFLDDDALAEPEWLSSLVQAFLGDPETVCAFGPIEPNWPDKEVDWLPEKYEGCLSILNLGSEDLVTDDFGYGANIAFKTESLKQVGGFYEAIGRKGSATLLSGEEVEVQRKLKDLGGNFRYVANASVSHYIHPNRVSRNWMRSRMAWQSVSEMLQDPPLVFEEWSESSLNAAAKRLGIDQAIQELFKAGSADLLEDQLDVIRHLTARLLNLHAKPHDTLSSAPVDDSYKPLPLIKWSTEYLFVEVDPGHKYLHDVYKNVEKSQFLLMKRRKLGLNWDPSELIQKSLTAKIKSVFLLTLDGFIYGWMADPDNFLNFIENTNTPVMGILHRPPDNDIERERFQKAAPHLTKIVVLCEHLKRHLEAEYSLKNCYYLPHHPSKHRHLQVDEVKVRQRLNIPRDKKVISLLGELRDGKGFELILESLKRLDLDTCEKLFFVIAGKAAKDKIEQLKEVLEFKRIEHLIDVVWPDDERQYVVISDEEYASRIVASDIGLLIYQGKQRSVASGVFSDYIWANKKLIATSGSFVGRTIEDLGVGYTLKNETPEELEGILTQLVRDDSQTNSGMIESRSLLEFRKIISPDIVVDKIKEIMS